MTSREQLRQVVSDEEIEAYKRVVFDETKKEYFHKIQLKGLVFGGEGLVAQVWYDDKRMIDFTGRLGERVRREVPSMDFQWGMVKDKVPRRVINLARFTGEEDRKKVVEFVDSNKDKDFGTFLDDYLYMVFSDHFLQWRHTQILGYQGFQIRIGSE